MTLLGSIHRSAAGQNSIGVEERTDWGDVDRANSRDAEKTRARGQERRLDRRGDRGAVAQRSDRQG